ncbi:MAG TPA: putative Ig domain-containing protein, partial [Gemmataceae bacterium]|nr:putative Ig domain-containing protein [Gemmataceae bacterium]
SDVNVVNSTFSSNGAYEGGAIDGNATYTITGCTFNANSASSIGGAIYSSNSATITNSTFTGNSADDGGAIFAGGSVALDSSTLVNNTATYHGGNIYNQTDTHDLVLLNSIIGGGTAPNGPDIYDEWYLPEIDFSMLGNTAGTSIDASTGTGNILNPATLGLGAFGDYGGPTYTIPLLANSPAISAGTGIGAPATDQRGVARATPPDMGAYQITIAKPYFTTAAATTFTVGKPGSFAIVANGPSTPTLSVSGLLPAGVTFVDNHNGTATLSGTPGAAVGAFVFNVTAHDGISPDVVQTFTLTVIDPPTITSASQYAFTVGSAGTFTFQTTAGLPAATTLALTGSLPAGLTFVDNHNGTATLKGTPLASAAGRYTLTLTASNSSGAVTQSFKVTINQAPAITSATAVTFVAGQMNAFTVASKGYRAAWLNCTNLPNFLGMTDTPDGTAMISGIPPLAAAGTYNVTLTAINGVATSAAQTLKITVIRPPTLPATGSATFTVGVAKTVAITATAGVPATTKLSKTGNLPSGLVFKDNGNGTATISGTPAAGTGAIYTVTITASNGVNSTATEMFTLTINQKPAFTSAAATTFSEGNYGTFNVVTTGFPAATLNAASLPSGATFVDHHNGTGTLAFTPPAGSASATPYTITLTATNGTATVTQSFKLTVTKLPQITSAASASFVVGVANTFTIQTTAGFPATTTLSISPALPKGLTFTNKGNGTATISGVAAAGTAGTHNFTITARNATGSAVTQFFSLTVNQKPAFTSAAAATFVEGQYATFTVKATGFPNASLSATLPAGLHFSNNYDGTATIYGTASGGSASLTPYNVTITAQNVAATVTQAFKLTVTRAPAFTSAGSQTFVAGSGNSFTVQTTAGLPTKTTLTISPALPAGLTFSDKGNGTAVISGKPAAATARLVPYYFTITARNATGSAATQSFSLTINSKPAITSAATATMSEGVTASFIVKTSGFPLANFSAPILPSWASFSDNFDGTGTLTATPTAGTASTTPYAITLSASNAAGSASQTFRLTVTRLPLFTSVANKTFVVGVAGSFTVQTTAGSPAHTTLSITPALPAGLAFHDLGNGTATLSGTPAAGTASATPRTFTIKATNAAGSVATQAFLLTISQKPAFTSAKTASLTVGQAVALPVTTTGFPYAAITPTGLPAGLILIDHGDGTATITGAPQADVNGIVNVTLVATNSAGNTSMTLTLTLYQPPEITSAMNASVAAGATFTVTTIGFPTAVLTVSGLPTSGVTFTDNKNGTATVRIATTAAHGDLYLTITATNGRLPTTTQLLHLTIT